MPVVKSARLRERIIDQLLRNKFRKYSVEDIKNKVNNELGTDISLATIYADIAHIRNEFDAKIIKNSHSQLFYEDPEFSINQIPLDEEDKKLLDMATTIFRIFSNSPIFAKFEHTIDKILTGSAITKTERNQMDCIQPGQTNSVVGVQYIEPILNAILDYNKNVY